MNPDHTLQPHLCFSFKSFFILSSHLWLCTSSGLFPSGYSIKTLYVFLFPPLFVIKFKIKNDKFPDRYKTLSSLSWSRVLLSNRILEFDSVWVFRGIITMTSKVCPLPSINNVVIYLDASRSLLNCVCCANHTETSANETFKQGAGRKWEGMLLTA
jgi:hypothetical protein